MTGTEAITGVTGEEMFESLTGFEEIAIGNAFGGEVSDLAQTKPTMFLRALVFVHQTRQGVSAKEAKATALGMTLKSAQAHFVADEVEPMPEEPISESGKDDAPSE